MTTHPVVETFDGSTAFRKDCRFIKGEHYIKNKQCFLIDGVWYRINSGFITYDHETNKWIITKDSPSLTKGIVSYDSEKKEVILGSFTANPYRNVDVFLSNGNVVRAMDYRMLPKDLFVEDIITGAYVHRNCPDTGRKRQMATFSNHGYPFTLQYCMKHYSEEFRKEFEKATFESIIGIPSTKLGTYAGVLGDFTFGLEFETNMGKIPNHKIKESGLMPLRDGSITGIEYATIVLQGPRGVKVLENVCEQLTKYTTITNNESLHLHIGGFKTDKKFIGYLYTLCCILEKDIYSIFPRYYEKTSLFKARQKDYNMPLRKELVTSDPEETFNNIAFYLGAGKKYSGFGANHPSDPNGDHKWGINERYHWVNFIPTLFGTSKTLEFRCHVPTRDPIKVLAWLYICTAIIKYAEKLFKSGEDISTHRKDNLFIVINSVYSGKLASYLCDYVAARKALRVTDDTKGDFTGDREIKEEMKGRTSFGDI